MRRPLPVIFVWHMHQPYYRDPLVGEYAMPWVYLHGIKDYYDMPSIVREIPGARCVFNLVPSLVEQILDYANGTAVDPFLVAAAKEPSELSAEERRLIVDNFFSANRRTMIDPYPRYAELLGICDVSGGKRRPEMSLSAQEILDLQVWFLLAWTGEAARRRFPFITELIRKGEGFTQQEKTTLLSLQREILAGIIPLYRTLAEEGKIEISVTPWFHPILPLLCSTDAAAEAMPQTILPKPPFTAPEDAAGQMRRGMEILASAVGTRPRGVWPSEGSVSDPVLRMLADMDITWCATDEGILARTLSGGLGPGRESLYQPVAYEHEGKRVALFFRDHALSDLIGFTYSSWEPSAAVSDFIGRLDAVRRGAPKANVVTIILDGENAWEYYPENGYPFLSRLYAELAGNGGFTMTTCSDLLHSSPPSRVISHIHPGSWINADFGIWIGHPEENRGWSLLRETREFAAARSPEVASILARGGEPAEGDDPLAHAVVRSLYAAEGSDWFWWYGDDHFTPHADRFDLLFRRHLMAVYRFLGEPVPAVLYEPIKKRPVSGVIRTPTGFISPRITGLVGDYFEWLAAGACDLSARFSTMHASETMLHFLYYGYDRLNFYVRIDGVKPLDRLLGPRETLTLMIRTSSGEYRIVMDRGGGDRFLERREGGVWHPLPHNCHWQIRKILELRIPIAPLALDPGDTLWLHVVHAVDDTELHHWPQDSPLPLSYLGEGVELDSWLI